jgi:phage terminase small subunit
MSVLANSRHEAFVQAYLANGGNGGEAYRAAYPNCKTENAAHSAASRLLKHVKIRERFAELQALTAEKAEITLVGLRGSRHRPIFCPST